MANEWYYTLNGQQQPAPANAAQLKQLASNGQLKPEDLVWQEGMANWAPASSVKGLFNSDRSGEAKALSGERPMAPPSPIVEKPQKNKAPKKPVSTTKKEEEESEESGMAPWLVLLLSLATCGLFGLWYIYKACSAYSAQAAGKTTSASGKPLGQVRHPVGVLVLSYLTFGYYTCYWLYRALVECAEYTGRKDLKPGTELALMLICPPYALFVAVFRLPDLIRAAQVQAKIPESAVLNHAPLFVNPFLYFALPLLTAAYQDVLNRIWQSNA